MTQTGTTMVLGSATMFFFKVYLGVRKVYHGVQWTSGLAGLGGQVTIYGDKQTSIQSNRHINTRHCKHLQRSQSLSVELIFAPYIFQRSGISVLWTKPKCWRVYTIHWCTLAPTTTVASYTSEVFPSRLFSCHLFLLALFHFLPTETH